MKSFFIVLFLCSFTYLGCDNQRSEVATVPASNVDSLSANSESEKQEAKIKEETLANKNKPPVIPVKKWQANLRNGSTAKLYSGFVDDVAIEMVLLFSSTDQHVSGFYIFNKKDNKQEFIVDGTIENDMLQLNEMDDLRMPTGIFTGNLKDGVIRGIHEKEGKNINPFELSEIEPDTTTNQSLDGIYNWAISLEEEGSAIESIATITHQDGNFYEMDLAVNSAHGNGEVDGIFELKTIAGDGLLMPENSGKETCVLDILYYKDMLYVEERDCSSYHGVRVTFWGLYRKQQIATTNNDLEIQEEEPMNESADK